ncbi:MAG: 5-oxoprolinase subunit PxpB [Xanthomonadales bacterium]|nr:Kinase A inhibitor [Xanthomonadales bacterium]MCC6593844.1 5-oxoprolinase subunit PxpB [Xanthomonadales bacterium]MCE7929947.1 5-oxoprolinase subunit PxpB [Xanthomonadales bacterium PRO6]
MKYSGMEFELWPLGDSAVLLRLGTHTQPRVNADVHRAVAALRAALLPGVSAIAPGHACLLLTLDLPALLRAGGSSALAGRVRALLATLAADAPSPSRLVEVPTRYGGDDGPDLDAVSQATGLAPARVVELHVAGEYRVAAIGFRPGFPYLLELPEALRLPRRSSVRPRVAAGSVAIAGAQTGIYPGESPGGWHLLGRTELALFDPSRSPPSLLLPGDRVRFVAVT